MLNLENWTWTECQLGNRAKTAQQFNLLGEKRKSEGKNGNKKEGGKWIRDRKVKMKSWKRDLKKEKEEEENKMVGE